MTKILLNGQLLETHDARVSVDERGFRFGDGVFETIPVHAGKLYLWRYHMERLEAGLAALRLPGTGDLLGPALLLLRENAVAEGLVRIHISRGG